jgi:RpiR family transcriptional regulator, carbohydrate utilization regulator
MNFIETISAKYDNFSRSEKKVADVVLQDPHKAISTSIASLAKLANVSEPSVHRFCQKVETKGFPDFKLHLAQSIAKGTPYVNLHVDENDTTENYTKKIFEASISTLNEARKSLDIHVIKRCVDILSCAKRITFCGLGASATVAHDMMNKFFRFNIPCNYFEDSVMMLMSAANSAIEEVFILVSHTGRTKDLVEVAALARSKQATVIGITTENSPLAKECTLVLSMNIPEDTDVYIPMASRLAQLTLVDVLATGLILRKGPQFIESLKKVKDGIKESRYKLDGEQDYDEQHRL